MPPVRKSLGQHFLTDRRILARIVDALAPAADETVIEIGPGRGALTALVAERCRRVVAIEVDRALAAMLRQRYAGTHVEIVEADVLQAALGELAGGAFALVGNVPYNITTPIVFHALQRPRASRMVFMVQREVADRMVAAPGGKEFGALSVNLQALAAVRRCFAVAPGSFTPPPKVDSAVVEIRPLAVPLIAPDDEDGFRGMVIAAFGQRRKQMKRVVRSLLPASLRDAETLLAAASIEPTARPETLSVSQFAALYRTLAAAR